jgi:hypothetical protein
MEAKSSFILGIAKRLYANNQRIQTSKLVILLNENTFFT